MNTGLDTLSQELKQDFILRWDELNTLRSRARLELKTEREQRRQRHHAFHLERKNECEQIRNQVHNLLHQYKTERKNLRTTWCEQCKHQAQELKSWARERHDHARLWNETVLHIRGIRRGE